MTDRDPRRRTVREVGILLLLSVFLAISYNAFSSKRIPLFRPVIEKAAVPDSILFGLPSDDNEEAADRSAEPTVVPSAIPSPEKPQRADQPIQHVATPTSTPEEGSKVIRTITLDQFKRLLDSGRGIVFDARDPDSYRKGRVKGARHLFGLDAPDRFEEIAEIPRDTLVMIYCNNPECHLGHMLADFMKAIGFTNLLIYDDGWDGWVNAGMPIDSNDTSEP